MNKLLKYLIYLLLVSLIAGPLGLIPIGIPQVNIYFTDVIAGFIALTWITRIKHAIKILQSDSIAKYFCIFAGVAMISWLLSPINLNINEKLVSGLYIVRLMAYFSVYLSVRMLTYASTSEESRSLPRHHPRCLYGFTGSEVSLRLLTSVGLILAALGWLQYFFYPDLRNLYYLGWDPHFARIFSTFLDPNYFGLMMVLTLILLFESLGFARDKLVENYFLKTSRLSASWRIARRIISITSLIFTFITLMFTYSRSSYLAFAAAMLYLSIRAKKIKIIMIITIILILSMFLLPRPGGAGVRLERLFSAETRVENWQQALKIFVNHPVLGVGFNTIRYAKGQYHLPQDNLFINHAGAGFDNSFLFIAATTGLIGLASYLLFLREIFKKGGLFVKTSLVAIIIHSFFLNSLFFPWVMVWMWVIVGIGTSHSGDSERSVEDSRITSSVNDSGQARMT